MDFGREKAMSNGVPNTNAWVRRKLSVRCDLKVMSQHLGLAWVG